MKNRKLLIFVLVFLLLSAGVNAGLYAYWGRRHKVLYDVDRVYVSQSTENQNIYYLTYEVSVKNWWFDFREHTYRLEDRLTGPYASWHFDGESHYFISENLGKIPLTSRLNLTLEHIMMILRSLLSTQLWQDALPHTTKTVTMTKAQTFI